MARKLLQVVGAVALVGLIVGSFASLAVVSQRVQLVVQEPAEDGARGPDALALLQADVTLLRTDQVALGEGLGQGFAALQAQAQAALESQRGSERERARELAALRAELEGLRGELRAVQLAARDAAAVVAPSAEPVPLAPAEPAEPAGAAASPDPQPSAPAAGASFLSFKLPSQSFRFDGRQKLVLLPALSRVGFDARSTLHDFSGVTQRLSGALEVDLARPELGPRGEVVVESASLDTGVAGRDEELRSTLDTARFKELRFTWSGFENAQVDSAQRTVRGTARGKLSIRGVARDVALPVRVAVDASQRVSIEGELTIRLSEFGIEAPGKLGVVKVEDELQLWLALRARRAGPVAQEPVAREPVHAR